MKVLRGVLHNRFFQGGLILTIANFIVSILNYFSNSLTAKALGPVGVGELFTLFAYLSIFGIPLSIMTTLIIKKLGVKKEDRLEKAHQLDMWFWQKIGSSKIFYISMILLAFLIPSLTKLSLLSSMTLVALVFLGFPATLYLSLLQGMHFFIPFTLAIVSIAFIRFLSGVALFNNIGSLSLVYISLLIGSCIPILVGKKFIRHSNKSTPSSPRFSNLSQIIIQPSVYITTISMMSIIMLNNIDIAFVKRFFTAEITGIYGAWSTLGKIMWYFMGPLNAVALIFFSAQETKRHQKKVLYIITFLLLFCGLILMSLYNNFSYQVIDIIFSPKFYAIEPYMGHAAFFGLTYAITMLINNYLISQNDRRSFFVTIMVIIYFIALLTLGKTLDAIMNINVTVSYIMASFYIIMLLHTKES